MSAPLKSAEEISLIINRGQHAIADIGLSQVKQGKRGINQGNTAFRDDMYRLILLRIYLQNILDDDGEVIPYYEDADNELKFNKLLDAIARLSQFYGGAAIPLLTGKRIPLSFFPSTAGSTGAPVSGGPAVPGGVTFQNLSVDSPGEVIDTLNASSSEYAFYIVNVRGTGAGEGSRLDILGINWRGASDPVITNYRGNDVGGVTTGVTYSAAIVDGNLELTCNVPTDGWVIRGSRISFENVSFQNAQGPLPAGGTVGQYLRKTNSVDYQALFATILMSEVDGLVAALAGKVDENAAITPGTFTKITYDAKGLVTAGTDAAIADIVGLVAALAGKVNNTGDETIAGVKTFSSDPIIPDEVYGAGWNGSLEPPTKNALYNKIEAISNTPYTTTGIVLNGAASAAFAQDFGVRIVNNKVEFRGWITGTPAADMTLFTLPVGYRPAEERIVVIFTFSLFAGNPQGIVIDTDGTVKYSSTSFQTPYGTVHCFDGVSFDLG